MDAHVLHVDKSWDKRHEKNREMMVEVMERMDVELLRRWSRYLSLQSAGAGDSFPRDGRCERIKTE